MKNTLAILALLSTGCSLLPDAIPLEVEHISHIGQWVDGSHAPKTGGEVLSTGFRWRRHGITLDILDGYCPEKIDNRHEVFSAKLSTEIPLK